VTKATSQAPNEEKGLTLVEAKDKFELLMEEQAPNIARATPDFIKSCVLAVNRNPALLECAKWTRGRASLIGAIAEAAELGMAPTGVLNRAWLAPFKEHSGDKFPLVKLMIGYEGLGDLLIEGGQAESWRAKVVYEGDEFVYEEGLTPILKHIPRFGTEDPNKITHAYAVVELGKGKRPIIEVMTKKQLDGIRAMARDSQAWANHFAQQCRKTVLRRVAHYLKLTPGVADVIARDDEREYGDPGVVVSAVPATAPLRDKLKAKVSVPEPGGTGHQTDESADRSDSGAPEDQTGSAPEVAGSDTPVSRPATVDSTATTVCGHPSPYGDGEFCRLEPDHKAKMHRGSDQSSWEGAKK
jgi:phage RecT family recombinase